jgi:hypothetical protein
MPARTFYNILARVLPHRRPTRPTPWDSVTFEPRIDLFLFVHLVEDLTPGLYVLVRDPGRVDTLKTATDSQFSWSVPDNCPSELPFFRLLEADCRRAAAQLSLGQSIAGASAFSLAMVGDFKRALKEHGAWYYRRLFWEAGMIGQQLYLGAEAAGLRATGIGAYFDDLVHETLGLTGHEFQSMYHFTIGGPVEDPRIMTAAAYPPPA